MAQNRVKRKLSAIFSADVKGYSRLMGDDEVATVRTITAYRELMGSQIQENGGRVVDSPGDNILAEFASVVDALDCAVKIQNELTSRNRDLPENRSMVFRIGINLGDVIQEDDRIYGDGVNIAARIEGLAEGGGICISRTAFDQVKNKLNLGYEYLGEHAVKNIDDPVRVYKVLMDPEDAGKVIGEKATKPVPWRWAGLAVSVGIVLVVGALLIRPFLLPLINVPKEIAPVENKAYPLPDKPSIAVLPFMNMSRDPEQEYLADGLTVNIINALSKISEIFVIARNSTFTYKGKAVKVQQVSQDLGVRHALEGSVQRSGERVRVSAQLADARSGLQLWSEQYDRDLGDLFALQDEITQKIVVALQVQLTEGEQARVRHRSTNNLKAWGAVVRGYSLFERYNKEDNAKARELFSRAIELDPGYATAWVYLAWTYWIDARLGYSDSREKSFSRAFELAQKAKSIYEADPDVSALMGGIHLFQRNYKNAIAEGEKSIALGPNNAENHAVLGVIYYYVDRWEETIALSQKAMRLSPYYPSWYLLYLGKAYGFLGKHEEAVATLEQLLERRKKEGEDLVGPLIGLIWNAVRLGRLDKARAYAKDMLATFPNFTLDYVRNENFFRNEAHLEGILKDLRTAGLEFE